MYAKSIDAAKTNLLPRSEAMNARYDSPDDDPNVWAPGDFTGRGADTHWGQVYAIQNPFTGEIMSPSEGRCWAIERSRLKGLLEQWGMTYVNKDMDDGRAPALVIKGSLSKAKAAAQKVMDAGKWPIGYWRDGGKGHFRSKVYLKEVRQGIVPMSYWSDEAIDSPQELGSMSWDHEQSGHSQTGFNELNALVGKGHGFTTVKPLKLFRKIVQIWCPRNGIVLDPFAGSGTTGHAVLESNAGEGTARRFILIEQGRPERGDPYARGLTVKRLKRAITGERVGNDRKLTKSAEPLPGGFRFSKLNSAVDAAAVLALEREEMIDLLLTTHWDQGDRSASHLQRLPAGTCEYLFARNTNGEGFFLVWNGPSKPSIMNRDAFRAIAREAQAENLSHPFHVYARISTYSGPNTEFYQIPNRILEKLGFNEASSPYGVEKQNEDAA